MIPAHGYEPARSPPQVAAQLERLYDHALEKFERWYQTFERYQLEKLARQTGQPNPAAQLGNALMSNGQMNATALIAMSSDKLREMGQPEHVIQMIEQRRNAYIFSQQERLRQRDRDIRRSIEPLNIEDTNLGLLGPSADEDHVQETSHRPPTRALGNQGLEPIAFVKDRALFDALIFRFHTMTSYQADSQMLNLGDRRIDLFQLHVEVGKRGGAKVVRIFSCY